ncbi:hypothetical protein ABT187_29990 [Streptomyces sp. NPDC001817]
MRTITRTALLVPVTALAAVLLVARIAWDSDTFQNCRYRAGLHLLAG